jgi:hypothetical protein
MAMRSVVVCLLPLLAACADATTGASGNPDPAADGRMHEISVEGTAAQFVLRPGLTLPEAQEITWNGKVFSFRFLENAGELPYPPPLPDPDMPLLPFELVYPNIAIVGGTEDPREAFIVKEIACAGGFEPTPGLSIAKPPRYPVSGEWVFEISARCDD